MDLRNMLKVLILLACATGAANAAFADPAHQVTVNAAENQGIGGDPTVAPARIFGPEGKTLAARPLSPQMTEIQAVLETERRTQQDLESRLALARDEETILELQRALENLAGQTELSILRIQLRYAREAGNAEAEAELERVITELTAPPVPGVPRDRPAPRQR